MSISNRVLRSQKYSREVEITLDVDNTWSYDQILYVSEDPAGNPTPLEFTSTGINVLGKTALAVLDHWRWSIDLTVLSYGAQPASNIYNLNAVLGLWNPRSGGIDFDNEAWSSLLDKSNIVRPDAITQFVKGETRVSTQWDTSNNNPGDPNTSIVTSAARVLQPVTIYGSTREVNGHGMRWPFGLIEPLLGLNIQGSADSGTEIQVGISVEIFYYYDSVPAIQWSHERFSAAQYRPQ